MNVDLQQKLPLTMIAAVGRRQAEPVRVAASNGCEVMPAKTRK
jgi:hypothetical protein